MEQDTLKVTLPAWDEAKTLELLCNTRLTVQNKTIMNGISLSKTQAVSLNRRNLGTLLDKLSVMSFSVEHDILRIIRQGGDCIGRRRFEEIFHFGEIALRFLKNYVHCNEDEVFLQSTPHALHIFAIFAGALYRMVKRYADLLDAHSNRRNFTIYNIDYYGLRLQSLLPPASRCAIEIRQKLISIEGIRSSLPAAPGGS